MLCRMDEELARWRYARMRWNAPLSPDHATLLLDRLALRRGQRIVDLGCGWGGLLLRAVETATGSGSGPPASGTGIDVDPVALDRGRALAAERGLGETVRLVQADAADWQERADRVLCIGAAHAFGGSERALRALADVAHAGGRVLFGDACWPVAPISAAREMFAEVLPLPELLAACRAGGWRVIHMSVADQREWDDFESTFRAGWQEWLLRHGDDPRAADVAERLDASEREYVEVYRRVLGFVYLVLAH